MTPRQSNNPPQQRRLILLGSTGSIGINVLDVVQHLRAQKLVDFEVVGLAAGTNAELLAEQARKFQVKHIAIADAGKASALRGIGALHSGPNAALELISAIAQPGDLVVGAMVGSAGLPATLAAIERGCDIALANKETLVAAGALVMPLAQKKRVHLLPIDSEHSAILQCLQDRNASDVHRIMITASGGPFRTWTPERIETATIKEALNHPTWNMGPKITIDSASLMNKALEIIEAHWLFGLPAQKIELIIHPQSLIHGMVEFVDGSVLAQLGPPDMRTPIQYALTWPHRLAGASRAMNWSDLRRMDFETVDHARFGAPQLAYEVIGLGGTAGAILNAANEHAVAAFLGGRIVFGRITQVAREALQAIPVRPVHTMDDVLEADRAARRFVEAQIDVKSPSRLEASPAVQ